ncbi:MAG: bifunctional DNA-formamidopyrimidine glycosylase/DNA-(apurinic or apyrimidinic site) lyase [Phycisphaerales bacterium]
MPELPEVEHLRRTLAAVLPGRRVVRAVLHRGDMCAMPKGRAAGARALLKGGVFVAPARHGKQLALVTKDGRALRVHLGMTGQLFVLGRGRTPPRPDHVHAEWVLDDGSRMLFRDPRRFGGMAAYATLDALRAAEWSPLGPDALTIEANSLGAALRGTRRAVKAALLDQAVLAGVGNIYADESLFAAGIHPCRRADRLGAAEVSRLCGTIRATLTRAVEAGGSTLRDYVDGNGAPGGYQRSRLVYGRSGEACPTCRTALRVTRVAQRTTVYCRACQPRTGRRPISRFSTSSA